MEQLIQRVKSFSLVECLLLAVCVIVLGYAAMNALSGERPMAFFASAAALIALWLVPWKSVARRLGVSPME